MKTLADLNTLVRLLNEFELPISPILEYAINECREKLSSQEENSSQTEPSHNVYEIQPKEHFGFAKRLNLVVYKEDGTIIRANTAAQLLYDIVMQVGPRKVFELKIPCDRMYLVTEGGNPYYLSEQKDLGNNFFLNTHSNTQAKKRYLNRIFFELNIPMKAEIIEE